jgi:hypothetical protein
MSPDGQYHSPKRNENEANNAATINNTSTTNIINLLLERGNETILWMRACFNDKYLCYYIMKNKLKSHLANSSIVNLETYVFKIMSSFNLYLSLIYLYKKNQVRSYLTANYGLMPNIRIS